jgi:hypothetical protein
MQLPIKESDRFKTAFNTKYGHYEWNAMPFGLCNSPATFVQSLNAIFSGEIYRLHPNSSVMEKYSENDKEKRRKNILDDYLCIYIDDLIVFSRSVEEHAEHLNEIFTRLSDFEFFIQSPKSFFAREKVEYLGHIVSTEGISAMDDKTKLVKTWPPPKTVHDVRQFLGLCGYYRKFVRGYAQIAAPLTNLTKKEAVDSQNNIKPEYLNETTTLAFETLRDTLCTAPVLKIPDPRAGKFHINCDASQYGLGATLSQKGEDGKYHPCAFASRVLSASERRKYVDTRCVYDLELAALLFALKKWRRYLDGQIGTTVDTDHKSLIWLQQQQELTKGQGLFLNELARNDLAIKYLKGDDNIPGDVPSRDPRFVKIIKEYDRIEEEKRKKNPIHAKVCKIEYSTSFKPEGMDAFLQRIEEGYKTDPECTHQKETAVWKRLANQGHELWYKITPKDDKPPRLFIPNDMKLKNEIIRQYHEPPMAGHVQHDRLLTRLKQTFIWTNMEEEVHEWARGCHTCQKNKRAIGKEYGELAEYEIPTRPWSSIAIDFVGPYASDKNTQRNMVMVAVCRLTKMAHFIACKSTDTAETIADLFVDNIIKLHGIPEEFRSDRDKWLKSAFWTNVWKRLGVAISLSTAHHHQTAGQVERVNQELHKYLRIYLESHADWEHYLSMAEFTYNSTRNVNIGCTPFEINYGFNPTAPHELFAKTVNKAANKSDKDTRKWLEQLASYLNRAQQEVDKQFEKYFGIRLRVL